MKKPFKNEPLTDFSKPENAKKMEKAIQKAESELGREYDIVMGGQRVKAKEKFNSINPSEKDQVIGTFQKADAELAKRAVAAAAEAFETWQFVPAEKRAGYLFKAAEIMRKKKHDFSAWMVLEEGKSWVEADADTAEAIDFLEFYAREMLRLAAPQPITKIPGEKSELVYIPLGVGAVIPPWNFPLAILVGMTSASVVAGNTVVLKPSSDSPAIAWQFMDLMEQVKLPPGVINFLTGPGGSAGNTLVEHPKTRFVAFTGSKEVGLGINEKASRVAPGQIWIKRAILEMGGKDSIVVSADADLEKAADGVCASAFGFQGQKCSACSRAIVEKPIYEKFIALLLERVRKIKVGPTKNRANTMGPVINGSAMDTHLEYIKIGRTEGKLLWGGSPAKGNGFFIEPTVIADVKPMARISQEEIFGPVLAIIPAKDYDEALKIANNTEYGLTGAVYTSSRKKIDRAKQVFHVGNLYFNRKCTGALVGAHPFGGFNMSGTDSKAGGRDYLLLFTQAKFMAEKIK